MSAVINRNTGQFRVTKFSSGSSPEHYKMLDIALEAKKHRLEVYTEKNTSRYLFLSSDISEFENRVEEIRDELLEGCIVISKADLNSLKQNLGNFSTFVLISIARLIEPLLEIEAYAEDAAGIIRILLKHRKAEVRYSALEAISFALGEVQIAEELLAEAKNLLKDEKTTYVREYLESL